MSRDSSAHLTERLDAKRAISFTGGPIEFADGDTVIYKTGSGLYFQKTTGDAGSFAFAWSPTRGVETFAVCYRRSMIAFVPEMPSPYVQLLELPQLSERGRLPSGAMLGYAQLSFSRGGERLVGLGYSKEPRLVVWSVDTETKLAEVVLSEGYSSVFFDPKDHDRLSTVGEGGLTFWRMNRVLEAFNLVPTKVKLGSSGAESPAVGGSAAESVTAQCWAPQGRVMVATSTGSIMAVEADTGEVSQRASMNGDHRQGSCSGHCVALIATRMHVIEVSAYGVARWRSLKDLGRLDRVAQARRSDAPVPGPDNPVLWVARSPMFDRMLLATPHGNIFEVNLEAAGGAGEVGGGPGGGADRDSGVVGEPLLVSVNSLYEFHDGPVLAVTALCAPGDVIVTGGQDGVVRVWDVDSSAPKLLMSSRAFVQGEKPCVIAAPASKADTSSTTSTKAQKYGSEHNGNGKNGATPALPPTQVEPTPEDVVRVPITSLAAMTKQRMLAVGTGAGHLSIFYVEEDPVVLTAMFTQRLCQQAISSMAFIETEDKLAVCSSTASTVMVITCSSEVGADGFKVTGMWAAENAEEESGSSVISAMAWQGSTLFYTDSFGYLYAANSTETWQKAESIGRTLAPLWYARLSESPVTAMVSVPSKSAVCVVDPSTSTLQLYRVPAVGDPLPAGEALPVVASCPGPEQGVVCMTVSNNGRYLALGTTEGSVELYPVGEGRHTFRRVDAFGPLHHAAIASLAFARKSGRLYCSGLDGHLFQIVLNAADQDKNVGQRPGFDRVRNQYKWQHINAMYGWGDEPTWSDIAMEKFTQKVLAQHDSYKNIVRQKVQRLTERLKSMLETNESIPDLEKLEREDFVVNLEARDKLVQRNKQEADDLRAKVRAAATGKDLVRARVLDMCWDTMEVHAKEIRALAREDLYVSNFPLAKMSDVEKQKLARVMQLRSLELKDIKLGNRPGLKAWAGLLSEMPHGIGWIVNEGVLKLTVDVQELYSRMQTHVTQQQQPQQPGGPTSPNRAFPTPASPRSNQEEEEEEAVAEQDDKSVVGLLYPSGALRTPNQKRTQILLLMEFVRQLKCKFNEQFNALRKRKDEEMETAEGRDERLGQILAELGSTEPLARPSWAASEVPHRVLEVSTSEMQSKPYETEAMREARLRAEEERRLKLEAARNENIGERALKDMMYGTLEAKTDMLSAAQALAKPEWMERTPVDQWTDDQKAEAEAYEGRKKKVQEEMEKKKKELELELKKLKTEILDAHKTFDEKVNDLANLKLFAQMVICHQELIVMRLAASLCHREDAAIENRRLEVKLRELSEQKALLAQKIAMFRQHYEACREETERIQSEDRAMERTFRKDLQDASPTPVDQDTLKILLQLYKSRPRNAHYRNSGTAASSARGSTYQSNRASSNNRASSKHPAPTSSRRKGTGEDMKGASFRRRSSAGASKTSTGSGASEGDRHEGADGRARPREKKDSEKDPFCSVEDVTDRTRRASQLPPPEIVPLSQEMDCPDGFVVQEGVWNRMQELRVLKIMKEHELRKATAKLAELKKMFDAMLSENEALDAQVASIQAKKFDTAETMAFKGRNTEVLVRLKQGQTEIDQEAVVTDYSETLLIPVDNVNKINTQIVQLGGEKVKMLNKIKEFRKSINNIAWEHRYLGDVVRDLEEHYKDLQLTRVTRDLQEMLNGNHLEKERKKLERGEARLGIITKAFEDRVTKLREAGDKLMTKVKQKEDENGKLEKQLKELRLAVEARTAIYRTRADGKGGLDPACQTSAKMKRVTMRRKLVELARSQTEEIEFLKHELDRLRQRTFPSFAQAARARMTGNPDEIQSIARYE